MKHLPSIFVGTLALALSASGQAGSGPVVTVVMDKLDDPRGLAFGPDGALYVTNHGASPAFTSATSEHKPLGEVLRIDLGTADDHGHDAADQGSEER